MGKRAFPPLPTRPQLMAMYPTLFLPKSQGRELKFAYQEKWEMQTVSLIDMNEQKDRYVSILFLIIPFIVAQSSVWFTQRGGGQAV